MLTVADLNVAVAVAVAVSISAAVAGLLSIPIILYFIT